MEVKLTEDEIAILRLVLSALSVKARTGELGVMHAGRFISVQDGRAVILKREDKNTLDRVARRLGINGLSSVDG